MYPTMAVVSPVPLRRPSVASRPRAGAPVARGHAPRFAGPPPAPPDAMPDREPAPAPDWPDVDLSGVELDHRYRLVRPLGVGGMGTVYLAEHTLLGDPCAIKVLGPRFAFDREWVRRFLNEARATVLIRHPNIVRVHDFAAPKPGLVYMAMELVPGGSLADLLDREGPLPWQRALRIADQIAAALEAAHARGIVHRDIKPSNCLRCDDDDDRIKVLDFGIAKFLDPVRDGVDAPRTSTDVWMGTAEFMAPELFRGEPADARVDIYALGALVFKLLTGRTPYLGNHLEVATQMLVSGPPMPSWVAPSGAGIPPLVDDLVARAIAHSLAERTPTMTALREQIAALLAADAEDHEPTVLVQLAPTLLAPAGGPVRRVAGRTAANAPVPAASPPGRLSALFAAPRRLLAGLAGLATACGLAWALLPGPPSPPASTAPPPRAGASTPNIPAQARPAPDVPAPLPSAPSVPATTVAPTTAPPVPATSAPPTTAPPPSASPSVPATIAAPAPREPVDRLVSAGSRKTASRPQPAPRPQPDPDPQLDHLPEFLTVRALRAELERLGPALESRCFAAQGMAAGTRLIGEVFVDAGGRGRVEFQGASLQKLADCIDYWVRSHAFPSTRSGGRLRYAFFTPDDTRPR